MLSEDDLDLKELTREELDAAWDLWFDLAQTTNDADPPYMHGVFVNSRYNRCVVDRSQLLLPPVVQENLEAFVTGLRARFGSRLVEVRLFGSYARGEAHEDSDVDCLVLLDRLDRDDDRAVTDLTGDLTWQIGGVVISPLVMSAADFATWKARERRTPLEIEREGIPL